MTRHVNVRQTMQALHLLTQRNLWQTAHEGKLTFKVGIKGKESWRTVPSGLVIRQNTDYETLGAHEYSREFELCPEVDPL